LIIRIFIITLLFNLFVVVKAWNVEKLYEVVAGLKGADVNSFYLNYCGE